MQMAEPVAIGPITETTQCLPAPAGTMLLPMAKVAEHTSLSRSTIYRLMHSGEFPKPVQVSPGRVAWRDSDLADWLSRR